MAQKQSIRLRSISSQPENLHLHQLERGLSVAIPEVGGNADLTEYQLARRMRQLEKLDITKTLALSNINTSHQNIAHYLIRVKNRPTEAVAYDVARLHSMVAVASLSNEYDLMASAIISEEYTSYQALKDLSVISGIETVNTELVLSQIINHIGHIRLEGNRNPDSSVDDVSELTAGYAQGIIDGLDRGLLVQLHENNRLSNRKIAEKLDVTEGTIRNRIRRLQEKNLLKFVPTFNPRVLGLSHWSWLQFDVRLENHEELIAALKTCSWIKYLAVTTGTKSLACLALTRNRSELTAIINDEVRTRPGVNDICESQLIANYKLDKRWGCFSEN